MNRRVLERAGWIVAILVVWELVRRLSGVSELAMPAPLTIASRLLELFSDGELLGQIAFSLGMIAVGLAIAAVSATVAILLASRWALIDSLLSTLVALLHPLPGVAILPVIILWFGIGPEAVLVVIVHSVIWPLVTNLRAGLAAQPEIYRLVGRNLGLSTFTFFVRVTLPAVSPYLISGVRISWSRSWRALISAEMIFGAVSGAGGLGWFLHNRRVFMDTPGLFAGLLVIMTIGVLVEQTLLRGIERITVERWGMAQ